MGFKTQGEALLQTLTEDVIKSSDIEGEKLDRVQVRSSIARRLGMDIAGLVPAYRKPESFPGHQGLCADRDDTRYFHQGQRRLCSSSTGRIYGSKPVPASPITICNMGGDHIGNDVVEINTKHPFSYTR